MKKFENGLFIFRRDFRIIDNNGLNLLNSYCENVYTIFIFTPEQVGTGNKYKSNNAVQFMIESLEDLASDIKKKGGHLYTFYGSNEKVIADCIKAFDINLVCFNKDITPYALERDDKIVKLCEKMKVYVMYTWDYYLHEPNAVLTGSNEPYQKFTPYYLSASKIKVQVPTPERKIHFAEKNVNIPNKITLDLAMKKFTIVNPDIIVHGGRDEALKQMRIAAKNISHYAKTRNELSKPTSQLSAYIKFGCISVREIYKTFRSKNDFIRQIYWRDFYSQVLYHFPRVLGHAMKPKYDKIRWHHNSNWFKSWCTGTTGYPIVDAGMRQLNVTGYMHNRARLIVASFLVKTLLINWEEGEKYFASKLTDYDPASNNGGWQWTASTGADSQPFFRIFNPWRQSEEYDPECEYIKKWIPELADIPVKDIQNWNTKYSEYKDIKYPKPFVNYEEQKEKVLKMYKSIL